MTIASFKTTAEWTGRDLFDVSGQRIGSISGPGLPRRKFGVTWLAVETPAGTTVLVPADQIDTTRGRLVLPYARGYVESGLVLQPDQVPTQAEARRLCLHFGLDSALPNSSCRQGCGLCMAKRRAERRS